MAKATKLTGSALGLGLLLALGGCFSGDGKADLGRANSGTGGLSDSPMQEAAGLLNPGAYEVVEVPGDADAGTPAFEGDSGMFGEEPGEEPGTDPGVPGEGTGEPGSDPGVPGEGTGEPGSDPGVPGEGTGEPGSDPGVPGEGTGEPSGGEPPREVIDGPAPGGEPGDEDPSVGGTGSEEPSDPAYPGEQPTYPGATGSDEPAPPGDGPSDPPTPTEPPTDGPSEPPTTPTEPPTDVPGEPPACEVEVCDGIDNDGDGEVDEGVLLTYYPDNDRDGYGPACQVIYGCEIPEGYVTVDGDLDDNDWFSHP